MTIQYQVILIGREHPLKDDILSSLFHHISELGIDKDALLIIEENNFNSDYKANAPAFCLYFGNNNGNFLHTDILKVLLKDASLVLPVVPDLGTFKNWIPKELHNINGFQLASKSDIESLVSSVLEGLSLLRLSRRVFISYKRDESSTVAIQLFEELEKNGFDVFLDTHSIRPGEPFQEELWHRMADTDIVVLLNTPGFLESQWTQQELAQANAMSIGILQLIWPTHSLERNAELCIPIKLQETDFGNNEFSNSKSYLNHQALKKIIQLSESLRARSLASRQDNIVTEFIASANKLNVNVDLQPEKFITIKKSDGHELVIIPTVGVPQAFTYNQSEELVARIKSKNVVGAYLLYDHRNIRERWLNHLAWLDNYLPIKTVKIVAVEQWLEKL